MLPPPPLPPMARPVAIISSTGDLTMVGSPLSPPAGSLANVSSSPHHQEQDPNGTNYTSNSISLSQNNELSSSPPLSPQPHMDVSRKSLARIASNPYPTGRDYAFNHFHTQSASLSVYTTSISTMSGVISPTNLSLYSSPVTTPRTTPRTRWNAPFLMEEDFRMITHPTSSNSPETNSVILMEEAEHPSTARYSEDYPPRDYVT